MFTRIVVGLAKSDTAQTAARHARDLALLFDAEVHFVAALPASAGELTDPDRRHAEGLAESLGSNPALRSFAHAMPGKPAEVIVRVANEVGADLVVVGNKGMRGVRRALGSVPNDVAHKAPCSVLIVDTTSEPA